MAEVHYLHRRWPRARALNKLRGLGVTAVGWQPLGQYSGGSSSSTAGQQQQPVTAGGAEAVAGLSEACTGWVV